jgi:hypothetical protein
MAEKNPKPSEASKAVDEAAATQVPTPVRYKVNGYCALCLSPGDVVGREAFTPRARFASEAEAEAATDVAIERLIRLGVISELPND